MRTRLPLFVLLVAATPAFGQALPKVVTFPVIPAAGQPAPDGAFWRAWSVASPLATMAVGTPENSRVGDLRPGTAFVDADLSPGVPALDDRVAVIEQSVPDLGAPGGLAAVIGVVRSAHASSFRVLPAVSMVSLEQPSVVAVDAMTQRITIAPLMVPAGALDDADGLWGYSVERCDVSLTSCVAIGRLVASAGPASLVDSAPAGTWRYAARAIFSGDVVGRDPSPASAPITVAVPPCEEPSAIDQSPLATPLLVTRDGASLHLSWEALGTRWDVARVALPTRLLAPEIIACDISTPSLDWIESLQSAGYLVAAHCGGERTSLGRDTSGTERPAAPDCP